MINRIVKLSFRPEACDEFIGIFEEAKEKIRTFEGCHGLKLLRCGSLFFTYSLWDNEAALNNYRDSELFKGTWAKMKVLFNDKPEAWSTEVVYEL